MTQTADFRIAHDGSWYHDGAPIKREALARLFGVRALKIDEHGDYWLQTPHEKYPIIVDDVPFIIVDYTQKDGAITLHTNMDETVMVGPERPLELRADRVSGDMLPYIEVRDGLYARLGRNVYYALIHEFGEKIVSNSVEYALGAVDD